tara:strand:- start:90 stop:683 length:594 start_codon:yes stop_codon:yes gene_type:complete
MNYSIYAESTPNPEVMKFVSNRMLSSDSSEYTNPKEASGNSLAKELFKFNFIESIFISSNFISIQKKKDVNWEDIALALRSHIVDYLNSQEIQDYTHKDTPKKTNFKKQEAEVVKNKTLSEIEKDIISLLNEYIKPAVEGDGGAIEFVSFKNGIVEVLMKGACSGCPSSTATLKQGILSLLKQKIGNEINDVVAING